MARYGNKGISTRTARRLETKNAAKRKAADNRFAFEKRRTNEWRLAHSKSEPTNSKDSSTEEIVSEE